MTRLALFISADPIPRLHTPPSGQPMFKSTKSTWHCAQVSATTCVSTARYGNAAGHNTHLVVDELTRAGTGIRVRRSKLNAEDIFTRVPLEQRAFHRVAV